MPKAKVVEVVETLDQMEGRLSARKSDLEFELEKTDKALELISGLKAITFHSVK